MTHMEEISNWKEQGLTYEAYIARWKERLGESMKGLDRVERRYRFYAKYNWERMGKVEEGYEPDEALQQAIAGIDEPQFWLVITEDWCLDSAYAMPILDVAARANPNITLRILLRDSHLDVMDRYLTNGKRNIPKLILFDVRGEEVYTWGPRPAQAQLHREALIAQGVAGSDLSAAMVSWYEEGGWRLIEQELVEGLQQFEESQPL